MFINDSVIVFDVVSFISNIDHLIEYLSNTTSKPLEEDKIINLEKVKFEDKMEEKKCFICLSDFDKKSNIIVLPCSHYSHSNCMEKWLRLTNSCPICRKSVE